MNYLIYFIQGFIIILLAPLIIGLLKKIKAHLRGFSGPSILQVYYDLGKLFRKERVISNNSSFITKIAPIIALVSSITAAFLVPVIYTSSKNYLGNIFIVIFSLSISKFLNTLIALDSSSTFGGMGSSRELFISMFAEPVMFILITFLYIETQSFNLYDISFVNSSQWNLGIAHIIAALGFFILVLAENSRMPIDNPETHLELTMIHEAMILDISGKDLGLLELSSHIKFVIFLTMFVNLFFPFGISSSISILLLAKAFIIYLIKMIIVLIIISYIEISLAKMRLFRVHEFLAMALSLSIIAVTISYFI